MMRMIPDEGIKPIEIKKAMISASADIGAVRGWGTDTFRAMRNNGLTRMDGRRIFLTDDGKRLLEAVDYGPRMSGNADTDFISDVARSRLHNSDAVLEEYSEIDRDVVPWILENWNK